MQFSFKDDQGLTPLGVGFVEYIPIEFIGLNSTSMVTPEVFEERKGLATALQENQYYQQKFNELVNGYIVSWDTASDGGVYYSGTITNGRNVCKYVNHGIGWSLSFLIILRHIRMKIIGMSTINMEEV